MVTASFENKLDSADVVKAQNRGSNAALSACSHSSLLDAELLDFVSQFSSLHTRDCYFRDIRGFLDFIRNVGIYLNSWTEVTQKMLLLWGQHLHYSRQNNNLAPRTVARKISSIRSFFVFLTREDQIPQDVSFVLKVPRIPKASATSSLSKVECQKVICYLKNQFSQQSKDKNFRSWAFWFSSLIVTKTLLYTGMRISELCRLRFKDLYLSGDVSYLSLTTKGAKSHVVALSLSHVEDLKRYLLEMRLKSTAESDLNLEIKKLWDEPLFCGNYGRNPSRHFHRSSIFKMLHKVENDSGINVKLTPHTCRATVATLLSEHGVPLTQIQEKLGHEHAETTLLYIKRNEAQLRGHLDQSYKGTRKN